MQVHKFGGASIANADAIKNVGKIIASLNECDLILVVSAIGKTTNAFEQIIDQFIKGEERYRVSLSELIELHLQIVSSLFNNLDNFNLIQKYLNAKEVEIDEVLIKHKGKDYNFIYDQIISHGEKISTNILHHYLMEIGVANSLIDATQLIRTDDNYTDANIHWKITEQQVKDQIKSGIYLTQGFIGGTENGYTTTLGREGSDYTASILSYCTNAEKMVVWKDVDGVYNADPKVFPAATVIEEISYREAIEMTFYGAQVIHPKTIKPLQNKGITLQVRSFVSPESKGTLLKQEVQNEHYPSIIVLKKEQVLFNFSSKDYSFLNEKNLGRIIQSFANYSLRINMMQNTAINFMVLTDFKYGKLDAIVQELKGDFEVERRDHLELLTIRHFNPIIQDQYSKGKDVIMAQKTNETVQYLFEKDN